MQLFRSLSLFLMFGALSSVAGAQAITSWPLKVYVAGFPIPLSTTVLTVPGVQCNQPLPPPGVPVNPNTVIWTDPTNVGKACMWTDSGLGPLFIVAFGGSYEATLAATNIAGTSPDSARVSFTRPGVAPSAPTGLTLK